MPKAKPKIVAGIVIIPDKGEIHTYSTADGLGKIKYRKLNSASMGSLRGTLKIDPRTEQPDEGELQVSVLAKAIVSWEGFIDEHGKPVPVTPEYIRSLPYLVFNELFLKAMPEVGSTSSPLPRSKRT